MGSPAARGRRYPYGAAPPRPVPQLQPQPQPVPRFALPSATKPEPATGFPPSEPVPLPAATAAVSPTLGAAPLPGFPPRPPVARRPRVPPAAAPAPEPAAAPPRRRRRGNRAGVQERARRVARAQEAGTRRQAAPAREHPFGSPPPPSPFRVWVNGGSPPAPASAARGALQSRATPAAQVSASPFFLQPVPQCLPPWLHRLRPDLPRNARS